MSQVFLNASEIDFFSFMLDIASCLFSVRCDLTIRDVFSIMLSFDFVF
jgi:hypothetical protein